MSPKAKRKKEEDPPTTEAAKSERVLLNPEEWKDPAGRKVVKEYHKKGLPGTDAGDEDDLDAFEQQWNPIGGGRTTSEYHKQDAPYVEAQSEQDGHQPRMRETSSGNLSIKVTSKDTGRDNGQLHDIAKAPDPPTGQALTKQPFLTRVFDVSTIEVLAFTVFRAMFGKGIRVPLKIEGSMDLDIAVKDTDVVINANGVAFEPPKLEVWHFIFAYKGKPVFEYGRGVERIKVHYYHAFVMLMDMWWGGKKKRKARAKADKAADLGLARYAAGDIRPNEKKGSGGDQ